MIERQHNQRIIVCDACEDSFEPYQKEEFYQMIAAAKEAGWKIGQDASGDYTHHCPSPSCRPMDRLERAKRLFGK